MIVVTGSTGRVGSLVAEELARCGERFRLLVCDPDRAPRLPGTEVVLQADYGEAESLDRAFQGGDRVRLLTGQDPLPVSEALGRLADRLPLR